MAPKTPAKPADVKPGTDPLDEGGVIPSASNGASIVIDPALVMAMQVFNWYKGTEGLVQFQLVATLNGHQVAGEFRSTKTNKADIRDAVLAVIAARPDLAAVVEKHPNGQKGPYNITTYGDWALDLATGSGSVADPLG